MLFDSLQPVLRGQMGRFGEVSPARGPELATANYATAGGFDNVTTPTSATSFTATGGTTATRSFLNLTTVAGRAYEIDCRVTSSACTVNFRDGIGGGGAVLYTSPTITSGQSHSVIVTATTATCSVLWINGTLGSSFAVDSISIREVRPPLVQTA